MLSCLSAGKDGGFRRFHGHDLEAGDVLLEEAARARDGRTGTHTGHQHVHMAHAVGKDLGAGGEVMGLHGQRVGELPEQQAVALFRQFFRDLDGPLHAFGGRGQHQFRAQGMQQVAAFHAHGIGHGQHAVQAPHGSHQGDADAQVAAGGLNDGAAGFDVAPLHGLVDHMEGHAILD